MPMGVLVDLDDGNIVMAAGASVQERAKRESVGGAVESRRQRRPSQERQRPVVCAVMRRVVVSTRLGYTCRCCRLVQGGRAS